MARTRFAPSPTGYLHLGGLHMALYDYLIARQTGGQFVLRIEDTDRERFVADGTKNILQALYWSGLVPDEGVQMNDKGEIVQVGTHGPYIQSERLDIYKKYAEQLLENGQAYYCFCTSERLEELRKIQQVNKQPTGYDGHCREIDLEEAKKRVAAGEKHVIRMKMPKEGETVFRDIIRGEICVKNELVDDQVVVKSDGFPTYHLAVVVDDHLMEITHVIRGEEWISSTPKHIQLYKYFGWTPPEFAHMPLLLNSDHSKLSKRQGDVSVMDYQKKGYLPEAVINFIAFLGWNPGDEREIMDMVSLQKEYKLEAMSRAGAVFNLEKLDWYNQQYLKTVSSADLVKRALPFLQAAGMVGDEVANNNSQVEWLSKAVDLERERIKTLSELPETLAFVFKLPEYSGEILVWKKSTVEEAKKMLSGLKELLNTISVQAWNKPDLEAKIGEWIQSQGLTNGVVLWPLRVSLSGQQNSPGPFEIAEVLGKDESLRRIDVAIEKI